MERESLYLKEKSLVSFLTISSFMLILFGLANVVLFLPYLGVVEVILGILLLTILLLFLLGKINFHFSSNLFLSTLLLCYFLLLVSGGIKGTGIFWIFTFPLVSFFLKESRVAAVWNLVLLAFLFLILILSSSGLKVTVYGQITLLQAVTVYTTFLFLVYVYSSVMDEYLERIYNTAVRDPLTGLYNRTFTFSFLKRELKRVKSKEVESLCIIYIDLDNFKCINDLHGHSAGDLALKEISELLRKKFREGDVVARIGGDEFLVVSRCKREHVEKKLEELRAEVEDIFGEFKVSISYGIAEAPSDGTDIEELVRTADKRMYRAKRTKKDESRVPSGALK